MGKYTGIGNIGRYRIARYACFHIDCVVKATTRDRALALANKVLDEKEQQGIIVTKLGTAIMVEDYLMPGDAGYYPNLNIQCKSEQIVDAEETLSEELLVDIIAEEAYSKCPICGSEVKHYPHGQGLGRPYTQFSIYKCTNQDCLAEWNSASEYLECAHAIEKSEEAIIVSSRIEHDIEEEVIVPDKIDLTGRQEALDKISLD